MTFMLSMLFCFLRSSSSAGLATFFTAEAADGEGTEAGSRIVSKRPFCRWGRRFTAVLVFLAYGVGLALEAEEDEAAAEEEIPRVLTLIVCFGKDLVGFGKFGRFSGALLGVGSGLKRIEVAFCVVSKVFRHEEI